MGNERLAEQLKFYKLIEKKTGFKRQAPPLGLLRSSS